MHGAAPATPSFDANTEFAHSKDEDLLSSDLASEPAAGALALHSAADASHNSRDPWPIHS